MLVLPLAGKEGEAETIAEIVVHGVVKDVVGEDMGEEIVVRLSRLPGEKSKSVKEEFM